MIGFNQNTYQKEIDVWVQDQITTPFHRFFMTEDKTDIVLTSPVSKNDVVINVSAGHGFVTPLGVLPDQYILISYADYYQQSKVISVTANAITISAAIGIDLPVTGTRIIRGIIDMNIDSSVSPTTYYCKGGVDAQPIDINQLRIFMVTNSLGDDSKFGGKAELTNGFIVRHVNGVTQNLGIYKANKDFIQFGASSIDNYTDKAGGGNYSARFIFNIKEIYGIVFRIADSGYLSVTINDDLDSTTQGLTEFRIIATGQITQGE